MSIALAESPLQLLCSIEAHAAGLAGPATTVRVRTGVPSIARASAELAALDLPRGLHLQPASAHRPLPGRVDTWVVGDAFSGAFQARLVSGPGPERIVLVDDGLATVELVRALADPAAPVERVGASHHRLRRVLGLRAARRLRGYADAGRLDLFTALPLAPHELRGARELGIVVHHDTFEWLAAQRPAAPVDEPTVIVGSGLVADGLVHPAPYLAWVRSVAADGPVRYLPHRRHVPELRRAVAETPGVVVEPPGAPVEIRLRSLGPAHRVVMLPSTALVLLRTVLARSGTRVHGVPVPDGWWTPRASAALRAHLSSVLDLARATSTDLDAA